MYRIKSSGQIKNQGEIRKMYPNKSIPKIWGKAICEGLGIDKVIETPQPEPSSGFKKILLTGAVQEGENWVQEWTEVDRFDTLLDFKASKVEQLKADSEIYRSTSRDYPVFKIVDLIVQYLWADKQPPGAVVDAILAKVNSFVGWYKDILLYEYQIKNSIKNGADFEAVEVITWDFTQFDAADPVVE